MMLEMTEISQPKDFGPPLEQPAFYKHSDDLELGDRVWIGAHDLTTPFEGEPR
jgi:hypothetical protein